MAKLYGEIAKSALLTLDKSFSRALGQPLDASEVYYSLEAAKTYAATPAAYVGQKIVVIEDGKVTHYSVEDTNGTLKEVGVRPVGDGKSIAVSAEGLVSILGADSADSLTLPRMKEDKSGIEWVPVSQVVEGDGNDNTTYTFTPVTKGEGENAETYGFVVKTFFNGAAVEGGEITLALDVYTKSEADAKFVAKADYTPYDDTEVRGLISDLDEAIGDTEGGLVKDIADNKQAIADEKARAEAAEKALGERIDGIDFIDTDELAEALEPINTALDAKAAQTDLEALQARVEAFLDNTGAATEAIDTLQDLITYINTHDDADINGILASIQAIEGKLAGIDSTVVAYVTAAIDALKIGDYAKASDLADLAARVKTLEEKPFDTYATKTEVQDVDAKFADYTKTADLNTALAGKVNTSDFDTFKSENTTAIGTAKSEAIAAAAKAVEDAGYAVATDVAETYATKDELAGVKTTAEAAATKSYVDTELGKKANADVVYTKSEIDLKIGTPGTPEVPAQGEVGQEDYIPAVPAKDGTGIFASTYSKAEINALLDEIEGGSTESAASVARQLDEFKSTTNNKLGLIDQKDAAQDTAIETAQTQANKGVADAAKAQKTADDTASALAILIDGDVKTNTNDINTIKGIVGIGTDAADTSHATRIGKLEAADAAHSAEFNALKGRVEANEGLITNKANAADVYTKTAADGLFAPKADTYTKTEVNDAVAAAITGANLGTYAKVTDVEAIYKAGVDGGEATGVLAAEITRAKAAEEANAGAISALIGEDSGKTVRAIAAEETAKIVADADAKYDTLKEIADFIMSDETGAAKMATDIAALQTAVGNAESGLIKAVADNAAAIAAIVQPKASEEVTVAEDGTLGLGEVSTDKLVQGVNTLVLNCGNAGVQAAE